LIGTALYQLAAMEDYQFERTYGLTFVILFMVIYMLIPFLYNYLKQQKSEAGDVFVLVGNALFHFGMILWWLEKPPELRETYDAMISLAFAVLFLVWSQQMYRRNRTDAPLVLASVSLTVLFASLAIPLQFGGMWVPLAWSLESAFLLWVALELKDINIQRFAWVTMAGAYFWYFFVAEKVTGGTCANNWNGCSEILAVSSSGVPLYLIWVFFFSAIALIALGRDDRKEYSLLPFAVAGTIVLGITFGLSVLDASKVTGLERFFQFIAVVGGSYAVLVKAKREWLRLTEEERAGFRTLGIGVQIATLTYLTGEYARAVSERRIFGDVERPSQYLQVGVSLLWALYAAVTLVIGVVRNWRSLRLFSIILLLIATAKLTIIDFFALGTGMRVIGFTILGALLVAASFLYQRKKDAVKSFFVSSNPPQ
jgi:uncharacterized membrane protein